MARARTSWFRSLQNGRLLISVTTTATSGKSAGISDGDLRPPSRKACDTHWSFMNATLLTTGQLPLQPDRIPIADPGAEVRALRSSIQEAVDKVLSGGTYLRGEETAALEREGAAYLGISHCMGV